MNLVTMNSKGLFMTKTHGFCGSSIYKIWDNFKQRCYNPKNTSYKWYGDKGIKVCESWKNDFTKFYDWAMENDWKKGLTIDRKDPFKDYSPENCQFISKSENSKKAALFLGKINAPNDRSSFWGDNSTSSKITNEQAKEIILSTEKHYILADKYGVHRTTISRIKSRITRKKLNLITSNS